MQPLKADLHVTKKVRRKGLRRPPSALDADDGGSSDDVDVMLEQLAMPAWDTNRFRLTEDSASINRLDPSMIQCLGIVKSKGRKRHLESSDASEFKRVVP